MDKTKKCTMCLVDLSLDNFYSKGNRLDSACKECVKSNKKAKYVSREIELNVDRLKKIFDIIVAIEIKTINTQISKLDEVIEKCQERI